MRVFSFFSARKSVISTSEIEKFTSEKKIFFSEIGISLGSVGERIGLSEKKYRSNYSAIIALCLLVWIHTLLTDYNPV